MFVCSFDGHTTQLGEFAHVRLTRVREVEYINKTPKGKRKTTTGFEPVVEGIYCLNHVRVAPAPQVLDEDPKVVDNT